MRIALVIAAGAELWVQPASAATVLSTSNHIVHDYTHVFNSRVICEDAYPCSYEVVWSFDSTWSEGFLRNYFYGPDSLFNLTKLEVNGTDYLGHTYPIGYLQPIPLLPTGNVLAVGGYVPWYGHSPSVGITRSPVPEPSTWAMMLIGFGFVGGAMRSRRRQKLTVSYA